MQIGNPISSLKIVVILFLFAAQPVLSADFYYPGSGNNWEHRDPAELGINPDLLKEAINFAIAKETKASRDLALAHYQARYEPLNEAIGPFKERGEPTGIILRKGYVVAKWGDPNRVDMTFSVTKSFLSTTVGLAHDRKILTDLHQAVKDSMAPVTVLNSELKLAPAERIGKPEILNLFESEHNKKITWDHLLRQVSDWQGTLWGKPDWADRPGEKTEEWITRKPNEPGAIYEYNDVRVNLLALAALNIWRRPLPQVLKEYIMDPIDASSTWRWHGYENSWVLIDGVAMQSVSGGGHWGGGMFINAWDMARFGYLCLRNGKWKERQLLSEDWIQLALTPTTAEPTYGFMNWFLNTDRKYFPSAPAKAFAHMGNGTNMIYVDRENELVVVVRWIDRDSVDTFLQKILVSLQ